MLLIKILATIERVKFKKTASLPLIIRENLVKELGKPTPYSPRLNIDF